MFRNILAQEKAVSILEHAIENDRIANSYLFYGPEGVGKFSTAHLFGMALNCKSTAQKDHVEYVIPVRNFLITTILILSLFSQLPSWIFQSKEG